MPEQQSHIQVALVRGLRTYLAVAVPAVLLLLADTGPSTDISAWKVALWSGIPAVVSFAWRAFLDPSSIPSLKDGDQPAPDGD